MAILYALFRSFTFLVSRLPFPVIYFCSGILRFFLQYIFRYRRSVIINNLTNSFPEKSRKEITNIVSLYYKHLADIIMEVIKLEGVKRETIKNRFDFKGLEIMEKEFEKGRSVIVSIGHCGNWEWMGTVLGMALPVKGFAIIKPLSDKYFNHYMEYLRHRFNPGSTIDFQHTFRNLVRNKKSMVTFNVFASDQTPTRSEVNYWSHFLNQDTAFFNGIEKLAKSLDFTVVFMNIKRTGRGRYLGEIELITNDPKSAVEHEITEKYIHLLENAIVTQPDNWLWSHRRWKFTRSSPHDE
jgi:Kdo2-lipid IVA lauroyltransferase/acyltransferase